MAMADGNGNGGDMRRVERWAENAWGKLIQRAVTVIGIPTAGFIAFEAWQEFKAMRGDIDAISRIETQHNLEQGGTLGIHREKIDEHGRRIDRLEQRVFR